MIKLKNILQENLLVELSERNTLYHWSRKKMKMGDTIKPPRDKTGSHWLSKISMEVLLEEYRKNKFPNRPSRFNCIYSSLIPRSRFVDKGYLYVIKPIGNMFMTNSLLIDEMGERFSRETRDFYERGIKQDDIIKDPDRYVYYLETYLAHNYWKGDTTVTKRNLDRMEVLSDSAKVVEVINQDNLRTGDKVIITEPNKVKVDLSIYLLKEAKDVDKYNLKTDSKLKEVLKKPYL